MRNQARETSLILQGLANFGTLGGVRHFHVSRLQVLCFEFEARSVHVIGVFPYHF